MNLNDILFNEINNLNLDDLNKEQFNHIKENYTPEISNFNWNKLESYDIFHSLRIYQNKKEQNPSILNYTPKGIKESYPSKGIKTNYRRKKIGHRF